MSNITLLKPTTNTTFETTVTIPALSVSVNITLQTTPAVPLTVTIPLKSLTATLGVGVGIDPTTISNVTLQQIKAGGGCGYVGVTEVTVYDLAVAVTVGSVAVHGDYTDDVAEGLLTSVTDVLDVLFAGYEKEVTGAIVGVMEGPVRERLNEAIDKVVNDPANSCGEHVQRDDSLVHFDESDVIERIEEFASTWFNVEAVNTVVRYVLGSYGGEEGGALTIPIGPAVITIDSLVHADDVGTFYVMDLFEAIGHYDLRNYVGVGNCSGFNDVERDGCHPVYVGATVGVYSEELGMDKVINVTISMGDLSLAFGATVYFSGTKLEDLTMEQVITPGCLVTPFENGSMVVDDVALGAFLANIEAGEGSKVSHARRTHATSHTCHATHMPRHTHV